VKSWVIAVGLSIAFHLGLVVVFSVEEVPVVAAAPVAKVGESVVSFTPVMVPEARKVEPQRKVAKPGPTVHPERSRGATESAEPVVPEGASSSDLVSPSVELATVGAEGVSPHPDPLPARGEGDIVAIVHARLAAVADGCYPAAARRFQQRGTVQLSFCTDAAGAAASTSVTQSSGAELLDAAARGCVIEAAAPFPPEAASRCFSVPVRFGAR
jgi:TonB family protein